MHTCNHTFPVAAYRISEYTMDVDFLQNHDAASQGAMPVYAQNGGAMNETEIAQIDGVRCALAAALEHLGAPVDCSGCKCHSVCVPEAATVCRVPEYVRAPGDCRRLPRGAARARLRGGHLLRVHGVRLRPPACGRRSVRQLLRWRQPCARVGRALLLRHRLARLELPGVYGAWYYK